MTAGRIFAEYWIACGTCREDEPLEVRFAQEAPRAATKHGWQRIHGTWLCTRCASMRRKELQSFARLGRIYQLNGARRRKVVMSLANGFSFDQFDGETRFWLRRRQLVNQTGIPTEKGRAWACELLAREADRLSEVEKW